MDTIQLFLLENRSIQAKVKGYPYSFEGGFNIVAGEQNATNFEIESIPPQYANFELSVSMTNARGQKVNPPDIIDKKFALPVGMAVAGYGQIVISAHGIVDGETVTVVFLPLKIKITNTNVNWGGGIINGTIAIKQVITLPPDSEAFAINVGTSNDALLVLGIPVGKPFTIDITYNSIAEMNAGFETDGVPLYGFAAIESDVEDKDNAKLFIKTKTEYKYLMDLSGSQGIQGPQGVGVFEIEPAGQDSAGGNKYNMILTDGRVFEFVAPKGERGDPGESPVTSVNGETGAVTLTAQDVGAVGVAEESQGKNITINADTELSWNDVIYLAAWNGTTNEIAYVPKSSAAASIGAMPISGGKFTGRVSFSGGAALPNEGALPYFLGIKAFADGGEMIYRTASDVLGDLGGMPKSGGAFTGAVTSAVDGNGFISHSDEFNFCANLNAEFVTVNYRGTNGKTIQYYQFCNGNGAGGLADIKAKNVYDNNQRVYSPNNKPPMYNHHIHIVGSYSGGSFAVNLPPVIMSTNAKINTLTLLRTVLYDYGHTSVDYAMPAIGNSVGGNQYTVIGVFMQTETSLQVITSYRTFHSLSVTSISDTVVSA